MKMSKKDVGYERATMVEELEEWIEALSEPPLWAWWPISDAGIEVGAVADFLAGDGSDVGTEVIEQVENASDDQIRNYADARLAWIERIWDKLSSI